MTTSETNLKIQVFLELLVQVLIQLESVSDDD